MPQGRHVLLLLILLNFFISRIITEKSWSIKMNVCSCLFYTKSCRMELVIIVDIIGGAMWMNHDLIEWI